jgi:flagellar basal-body rod modification protein FlgD
MSEIDPYAGVTGFPSSTASSAEPESLEKSGLGRDAFLQIFLTQLANQDPLAPQDASQLSAQLATFSQVEQQTLMAEQLRGVNTRLDSMLEALKGSPAGSLDPVSLIGKEVRVSNASLRADGGAADVLNFEVSEAGVQGLLISGETTDGRKIGLATLGVADGAAELARGTYRLKLAGGGMQLELPDGRVLSGSQLPLSPFVMDETTGQPHSVLPGSPGARVLARIASGASHELSVGTTDRQGAYKPVTTHVDGSVSAVRVVDGKTVVTVNGSDRDLSKVIQVQ